MKKNILIEVDVATLNRGGPGNFIKGLNDILPYKTKNCNFIPSRNIYPIKGKRKTNFYYIPFPHISEQMFNKWINIREVNKLILGPCFVPYKWRLFPNKKIWKERNFIEILKRVKGIAVHSVRVRNYLSKRVNAIKLLNKFKIIRPCTNIKPKYIKPFNKRNIDILFFEKYKDFNYSQQGKELFYLFNNTSKKITRLIYGTYSKRIMQNLANDTKFIIYFSFFDTGAIGLKEIQNYGVIAFTLQSDFVIHKNTSFYVPELMNKKNMTQAFNIIMKKIEDITKLNPNTKTIAKINQEINKCQNALYDLCKNLS